MICPKCGKEIEDGSIICPHCNANISDIVNKNIKDKIDEANHQSNDNTDKKESAQSNNEPKVDEKEEKVDDEKQEESIDDDEDSEDEPKKKSSGKTLGIIIAIIAAIAIVAAALILIFTTQRTTIILDNYVIVYASGYNGHGTANVQFNTVQLEADYWNKLELTSEKNNQYASAVDGGEQPIDIIIQNIDGDLTEKTNLSNGDVITFVWDTENIDTLEKCFKVKLKMDNFDYTVDDLEALKEEDIYTGVSLEYSGVAPKGEAYVSVNSEVNQWLQPNDIMLDKSYDLSNGDTITASISDTTLEKLMNTYGVSPIDTEKEFTVKGLSQYITGLDQIPDDNLARMTNLAIQDIQDTFWSEEWGASVAGSDYLGAYLVDHDGEPNDIYMVFKVDVQITYNEETENFDDYWYCCYHDAKINGDGNFSIDYTNTEEPDYDTDITTGKAQEGGFSVDVGGQGINMPGFESLKALKDYCDLSTFQDSTVAEDTTID